MPLRIQTGGGGENKSSETVDVKFSLMDGNGGACALTKNGDTSYNGTVMTETATLQVIVPRGIIPSIDGTSTRSKVFTFAENGDPQTAHVVVTPNGGTPQNYTVTVRYYKGAIKKVIVTDDNNATVSVGSTGAAAYMASVGTSKAKVEVVTVDAEDTVKFDGADSPTKKTEVQFAPGDTKKELQVTVTHKGVTELYTITVYYSDPAAIPKEAVLTGITVTDADHESTTFALSPAFHRDNSSYTVAIPSTVGKIKVAAQAETGISADVVGGPVFDIAEGGSAVIKVKAVPPNDPISAKEYDITVRRASASDSSNADLASLELESKYIGAHKDFKESPAPFDKATTDYTCKVNASCDEFFIKASPDEEHARMTVSVNGAAPTPLASKVETKFTPLPIGTHTFAIKVTAQNAVSEKTYTITVIKAGGSLALRTLNVSGIPDFYSEWFKKYEKGEKPLSKRFDQYISSNASTATITAVPEYPDTTTMKIKINRGSPKPFDGSKTIDLTNTWPGKPNAISVQIILDSSTATGYDDTYYLWIYKKPPSGENENSLENLQVSYYGKGYKYYKKDLNETFAPDKTDYTLTLPAGVNEIKVTAEPKSAKAFIDGWGGKTDIFWGPFSPSKPIKIPVVAENGERKVYTIAVTQLLPTTITIESITNDQVINLAALTGGLSVSGSFTSPDNSVSEVWVGSSGLPIQSSKGGKWVQADITGTSFSAVLPLDVLKDIPNGSRDIKVMAINSGNQPIAVARVPVTIQGNPALTAPVTVQINAPFAIPSTATMSIVALDQKLWIDNGESVIFASKVIKPIGSIQFPTKIQLPGITAGRECRVEVNVYEHILGKDVLLYYDVVTVQVEGGKNNMCTATLKRAQ